MPTDTAVSGVATGFCRTPLYRQIDKFGRKPATAGIGEAQLVFSYANHHGRADPSLPTLRPLAFQCRALSLLCMTGLGHEKAALPPCMNKALQPLSWNFPISSDLSTSRDRTR